jgi:hypothetical protein
MLARVRPYVVRRVTTLRDALRCRRQARVLRAIWLFCIEHGLIAAPRPPEQFELV